ncbi:MAG: flagellar hook-length control protein FliK [Pseudomonadota bacterium]
MTAGPTPTPLPVPAAAAAPPAVPGRALPKPGLEDAFADLLKSFRAGVGVGAGETPPNAPSEGNGDTPADGDEGPLAHARTVAHVFQGGLIEVSSSSGAAPVPAGLMHQPGARSGPVPGAPGPQAAPTPLPDAAQSDGEHVPVAADGDRPPIHHPGPDTPPTVPAPPTKAPPSETSQTPTLVGGVPDRWTGGAELGVQPQPPVAGPPQGGEPLPPLENPLTLAPRTGAALPQAAEPADTAHTAAQAVISAVADALEKPRAGAPAAAPAAAQTLPTIARQGPEPEQPRNAALQHNGEARGRGAPMPVATAPLVPVNPAEALVRVVRTETHLPPVQRALPTSLATPLADAPAQEAPPKPSFSAIAPQLKAALEAARAESEPRLPTPAAQSTAAAQKVNYPVKLVELSLQPASLGTIAITMRLSGTGLRLSVTASNRETVEALRDDRGALGDLLAEAGYEASEINIAHRP